jgi:hypothetical protein
VAAAEADEPLVQAVGRPALRRQFVRAGREGRADLVVAAFSLLLDAAEGLLVAVVDARYAAGGHQHGQRVTEMAFVGQLAGQPGDVVVPGERLRHHAVEYLVVPAERPGQLEEVPVVQGAPDRLP